MDELINRVIDQIREDIHLCEFAALDELLRAIPKENLEAFLGQTIDDLDSGTVSQPVKP